MPRRSHTTSNTNASTGHDVIPETFIDGLPLPRLLVFDLDYTLWPFWVDTHVSPPLTPASKNDSKPNTAMIDAHGETFTFYREVPSVLYTAHKKGISMGLASRTHTPDLAGIILKNVVISPPSVRSDTSSGEGKAETDDTEQPRKAWDFFKYREIYPGSKTTHFQRIHSASKKQEPEGQIDYGDMVFFDDESRNKDVERKYGVVFVLVRDGVTADEVDRGVRKWRERKGVGSATETKSGSGSESVDST